MGFIQEEGLNVLGRTLTVVGGTGQVLLGAAVCVGIVSCAGGAGIITLGASNIQEGFTGQDGFARDGFQALFGETGGDLAFGATNLGTSVYGLMRGVLSPSAGRLAQTPLFRSVPNDYVPAYTTATRSGLAMEALTSGADIVDTVDRSRRP